jgi:hypothetical protein
MPTRVESGNSGVQAAVHDVAEHARTLVRLEAKLAALEVRQKAAAVGAGAGLLVAGGVFGLFALSFLLAAAAAGLATGLPTWLALLIVGGALVLLAVLLVAVGLSQVRKGVPPVPEQAIREARLTSAALKGRNDG